MKEIWRFFHHGAVAVYDYKGSYKAHKSFWDENGLWNKPLNMAPIHRIILASWTVTFFR
jgi:hypothetical protein